MFSFLMRQTNSIQVSSSLSSQWLYSIHSHGNKSLQIGFASHKTSKSQITIDVLFKAMIDLDTWCWPLVYIDNGNELPQSEYSLFFHSEVGPFRNLLFCSFFFLVIFDIFNWYFQAMLKYQMLDSPKRLQWFFKISFLKPKGVNSSWITRVTRMSVLYPGRLHL